MRPDEIREHMKQIPGLGSYPIRDYADLARMVGGKHKEFKFKDTKLKIADVMRMFPANYFPIASERDLMTKIAKLQQLGQTGLKPAKGARPANARPPAITRDQDQMTRKIPSGGHKKK